MILHLIRKKTLNKLYKDDQRDCQTLMKEREKNFRSNNSIWIKVKTILFPIKP